MVSNAKVMGLEKDLNRQFDDKKLLDRALTHKAHAKERQDTVQSPSCGPECPNAVLSPPHIVKNSSPSSVPTMRPSR